MSASDELRERQVAPRENDDLSRRRRQRRNLLLLILASGFLLFGAAASALFYVLQPLSLRIAVGPKGSDDEQLIQAMAKAFAAEGRSVRLVPVTTDGAAESLALLGASKADLAVGRADLDMPANAQTVAIVRENFVVLWTPTGLAPRGAGRPRAPRINEISDLAGRRVGVIGRTPANVNLLKLILSRSGVAADKVAVTQFATGQTEELARDQTLDAYIAVGPLDSKITSDAIAATARVRGAPKFLAIDASEAIALKHPLYESGEIPPAVFNASPSWPDDTVETLNVNHLIVAREALSETTVAAFTRQLFAVRQSVAKQVSGAANIKKPDTDKDAELPIHRGAAAFVDGTETTFTDRYSDYFWFTLLVLSGLGSAGAWLRQYSKRDEREETTRHRNQVMAMVSNIRTAKSAADLAAMQREVDAIIRDAVACYDDDGIDEGDLAAFGLVLELFHHAIAERRAEMDGGTLELARRTMR